MLFQTNGRFGTKAKTGKLMGATFLLYIWSCWKIVDTIPK